MSEEFPQEEQLQMQEGVDSVVGAEQAPIADVHESELTHIPVHTEDEDQAAGSDPAHDAEIEERLNDLRERGRVGVLTEGTERPDTSDRIKNSDHDPEAVALVNKRYDKYSYNVNQRPSVREIYDLRDEDREDVFFGGERAQENFERNLKNHHEDLKRNQQGLEISRGDILEMYARNPEKYKGMSVEEFVEQGDKYLRDVEKLSRKDYACRISELLIKATGETDQGSPKKTAEFINKAMLKLRSTYFESESRTLIATIKGFDENTVEGVDDRNKRIDKIWNSIRAGHDLVTGSDFIGDNWDTPPSVKAKEMSEHIRQATANWREEYQKAKAEFEEKWGVKPEKSEEPERAEA